MTAISVTWHLHCAKCTSFIERYQKDGLRSETAQPNQNAVLRVKREDAVGRVNVRRRELKREALQDHADGQLRLQQREVLADADAGSPAEGDEGARVAARLGHALGEPPRVEIAGVVPPKGRVPVDEHDGHHKHDIRWVRDASKLCLLVRPTVNKQRRRIKT